MNELDRLREKIDGIDQKLAGLLSERLALSKEIGAYKKTRGLEILQSSREAEVKENVKNSIPESVYAPYILEIYETILKTSKKAQD